VLSRLPACIVPVDTVPGTMAGMMGCARRAVAAAAERGD
jgi:hypothetical protein